MTEYIMYYLSAGTVLVGLAHSFDSSLHRITVPEFVLDIVLWPVALVGWVKTR